MKQHIEPLGDRVVVRRVEEDDMTSGGIIIPDKAKEKPQKGEVLAIGSGKLLDNGVRFPVELEIGDFVYFGKFAGMEIKVDGRDYLILREDDILCKVF